MSDRSPTLAPDDEISDQHVRPPSRSLDNEHIALPHITLLHAASLVIAFSICLWVFTWLFGGTLTPKHPLSLLVTALALGLLAMVVQRFAQRESPVDVTPVAVASPPLVAPVTTDEAGHAAELQALHWIAQAINFSMRIDDLMELIYTQTQRVIDLPNFYIALKAPEANDLAYAFYIEGDERLEPIDTAALQAGLAQAVISSSRTIRTDDYATECHRRSIELNAPPRERAWMGTPLTAGDRTVGVMVASACDPYTTFTEANENFFVTVAAYTASILERHSLYERLESRARQLGTLNEIGNLLASSLDLNEVLDLVVRNAAALLNSTAGSLLLLVVVIGLLTDGDGEPAPESPPRAERAEPAPARPPAGPPAADDLRKAILALPALATREVDGVALFRPTGEVAVDSDEPAAGGGRRLRVRAGVERRLDPAGEPSSETLHLLVVLDAAGRVIRGETQGRTSPDDDELARLLEQW